MSEINTNLILDGISLALRGAYPDSQINSNPVEQGLEPPAFIIRLVNVEQVPYMQTRRKRFSRFDVCYFPKAKREECYAVADKLCQVLELLSLPGGDMLRGTDISFSVEDGVLHFLVSYNHFTYTEVEKHFMEDITINQEEI